MADSIREIIEVQARAASLMRTAIYGTTNDLDVRDSISSIVEQTAQVLQELDDDTGASMAIGLWLDMLTY